MWNVSSLRDFIVFNKGQMWRKILLIWRMFFQTMNKIRLVLRPVSHCIIYIFISSVGFTTYLSLHYLYIYIIGWFYDIFVIALFIYLYHRLVLRHICHCLIYIFISSVGFKTYLSLHYLYIYIIGWFYNIFVIALFIYFYHQLVLRHICHCIIYKFISSVGFTTY